MTGAEFLDFFMGTATSQGMLDKNPDDTGYRALVLKWMRLVCNDIANRQQNWHWKWLETKVTAPTVVNQMDYDLPADIDTTKIFKLFDRNFDRTYTYLPYEKFVDRIPDPTISYGEPCIYTVWAGTIKLFPIPNLVFTVFLDCVKKITPFTDAAVSIEIPDKYDHVIIDGVLKWAYKFDPELGDEVKQTGIYENDISLMMMDNRLVIDNTPISGSHRVRYNYYLQEFQVDQ